MTLLSRLATALVGLSLLLFGFWSAHVEQMKPQASALLTLVWVGVGILGGLLLPFVGGKLADAAKTGISLGSAGRRAYDGQVVAPPKDGAP